jgi:spore coat polysaccharide biosynthesis protein SpsF (cytidylyltransferase family)
VNAQANLFRSHYFLTVDYPEDLLVLRNIYAHFEGRDDARLSEVVSFLDSMPEVARLNARLHQGFKE